MAVKQMVRSKADDNNGGGWWHTSITLASGVSDTWMLPVQPVMSVGARIVGSGILSFTIDDPDTVEAGTAGFEDWDGIARINTAVTGFKLTQVAGTVTAVVNVKTFYAS